MLLKSEPEQQRSVLDRAFGITFYGQIIGIPAVPCQLIS